MPSRVLRDGILDSKRVGELSERAELFYRKLFSVVDDYGRYEADVELLRVKLYARRLDEVSVSDVAGFLQECCEGPNPLVLIYEAEGKKLLQIVKFGQRVRTKKYPDPPPDAWAPYSGNGLAANSRQMSAGVATREPLPSDSEPMLADANSRMQLAADCGQLSASTLESSNNVIDPSFFGLADKCQHVSANARLARASTTTTTATATATRRQPAENRSNGNGHKPDGFDEFWFRYGEATGKPVTEADRENARDEWAALSMPEQLQAVAYIPRYLEEAAPSHPRYCLKPAAYLAKRSWTAISLKQPQREPSGVPIEEIV